MEKNHAHNNNNMAAVRSATEFGGAAAASPPAAAVATAVFVDNSAAVEAFRALHPERYLYKFLLAGIRDDGRRLDAFRSTALTVHNIETCAGSSVARIGATTVFVGVSCEPMQSMTAPPSLDELFSIDVKLSPLAAPRFRQPRLGSSDSKRHAAVADMIRGLLSSGGVLSTRSMQITDSRSSTSSSVVLGAVTSATQAWYWKLFIDVVCTAFDGSIEDAATLAVMGALGTLEFPSAARASSTSPWVCSALERDARNSAQYAPPRRLALGCVPVSTSHILVQVPAGLRRSEPETAALNSSSTSIAVPSSSSSTENSTADDAFTPSALLVSDPSAALEELCAARIVVVVDCAPAIRGRSVGDGATQKVLPLLGTTCAGSTAVSTEQLRVCTLAAEARARSIAGVLVDAGVVIA